VSFTTIRERTSHYASELVSKNCNYFFRELLTTWAITARLGDRTIRVNALGLGHVHARRIRRLFSSAAVRVRLAGTTRLVHRRRFNNLDARSSASLASHLSRASFHGLKSQSKRSSSQEGLAPRRQRHRHRPTKTKNQPSPPSAFPRPVASSVASRRSLSLSRFSHLGR